MFLKLKSDEVTINRRGCTDGRKHRDWLSNEDKLSPNVSTESIMLSCIIDATESQELATEKIPGDFLQTEYYKGDIHTKLEGDMVTLLEDIDQLYYKYFIYTDKRVRK